MYEKYIRAIAKAEVRYRLAYFGFRAPRRLTDTVEFGDGQVMTFGELIERCVARKRRVFEQIPLEDLSPAARKKWKKFHAKAE